MRLFRLVGTLYLLMGVGISMAQEHQNVETGFLNRTISCEGYDHKYQVYVPRDYNAATEWPVILFLHGSGERGDDGMRQTQVGLADALRWNPERWPAIVVFPQAPDEASWVGAPGRMAMAALEAAIAEFRVDQNRIYLTGLSLGGEGAWHLAYEHPERFAALVPICGFVEVNERYSGVLSEAAADPYPTIAQKIADIPVWIFHGGADPVVPVEGARQMATALIDVHADVTYSELAGVGHAAWEPAYGLEDLATWLFAQKKK